MKILASLVASSPDSRILPMAKNVCMNELLPLESSRRIRNLSTLCRNWITNRCIRL